MKAALSLVIVLVVQITTWVPSAQAQAPCRFVLGFSEMVDLIGPASVGPCLENQWTLTGFEEFTLGSDTKVGLSAGVTVQRTQRGLLTWDPTGNLTQFYTNDGAWDRTATAASFRTWREILPRPSSTTPAATSDALGDARSTCFRAATGWMPATLGTSLTHQQRAALEAEGNAKGYLCEQALERDGPRGVECFVLAWDAATGMERIFAGSGRQVYDEKYGSCMRGR